MNNTDIVEKIIENFDTKLCDDITRELCNVFVNYYESLESQQKKIDINLIFTAIARTSNRIAHSLQLSPHIAANIISIQIISADLGITSVPYLLEEYCLSAMTMLSNKECRNLIDLLNTEVKKRESKN